MVKRIFGAKFAPASDSAYRRLAQATRIGVVLTGFAAAAALPAPSAAQTPCISTGPRAVLAARFTPFASNGGISSLVSAINTANTAFLTQSTAFIGSPSNPDPNQLGGGVWARGIDGQSDFKSTAATTLTANGQPAGANVTCNTKTNLSFGGVQIGTDTSILNIDGWNLHGGSTLGYLAAGANDFASGGTFSDTLQIPFVGFYGAATKGGLFIDGQARWTYFENNITDTSQGVFGQNLDARGVSVNGNIGYNYGLPDNWFIEPSAGILWSNVSVDPLQASGTFVLGQSDGSKPGVVSINPIYSTLGRVSLRVGTSFDAGGVIWQPFTTVSGFREFVGNNSATFTGTTLVNGVPVASQKGGILSATNIGNYGQFGLGVAAILPNTGLLGYVRGDYRTGEHIDGWSINAGLRYQLNPDHPVVTGRSADVPGAPIAPAAYNWTGFYLGPQLGVDWGYTSWSFAEFGGNAGGNTHPRFAGILPGGQVGYNYQSGKWVFGVEGDIGWTNARGARPCPGAGAGTGVSFFFTCEINVNYLSTVTGRIGFTYPDKVLWYAKGGLAIGEVSAQIHCNTDSSLPPGCPVQGTSRTDAGWTVGGGSELALTDNWSVKAETSYFNLGTGHYSFGSLDPGGAGVEARRGGWISTIGLNYRFTGFGEAPAVVAKY
jgi:opacity protein-like surface antigen